MRMGAGWGCTLFVLCACSSSSDAGLGRGRLVDAGRTFSEDAASTMPVCGEGDTRRCVGPGACEGAQRCLDDGSGFGDCDCGVATGAGGVGGAGGTSGAGGKSNGGASSNGDGGRSSSGGAGASSGGGVGGFVFGSSGGSAGGPAGCVGSKLTPQAPPVGLYVMQDQSVSMGDPAPAGNVTWWSVLTSGIGQFVDASAAAGTYVGIQYFPLGGYAPASCQASYAIPEVELAALPGVAGAIKASLAAHGPTGFTPTAPALSGAIAHMKAWAAAHPDRTAAVAFITDGFPTECEPQQISDVVTIAKDGSSTSPPVYTYVIGLNMGTANLDAIAAAGGTRKAVSVSSGDIPAQVAQALLAATQSASACTLSLPLEGIDPNKVNLRLGAPPDPDAHILPEVTNQSGCNANGNDGWYYDNPTAPKTIILCPATCASGGAARVTVEVGCVTVRGNG